MERLKSERYKIPVTVIGFLEKLGDVSNDLRILNEKLADEGCYSDWIKRAVDKVEDAISIILDEVREKFYTDVHTDKEQ